MLPSLGNCLKTNRGESRSRDEERKVVRPHYLSRYICFYCISCEESQLTQNGSQNTDPHPKDGHVLIILIPGTRDYVTLHGKEN